MNRHTKFLASCAALLLTPPLLCQATVFFNDTFGSGSTLNSATPAAPTANSTSYQLASSKPWVPTPAISSGDLKYGIAATTAGHIEAQALFATSPVALVQAGDYVRLTVVFTNTAGLLTAANTFLGIGLYNSGQVPPVAGGLNGTGVNSQTGNATGGVQNWLGYWAQISYSGQNSRILTRPAQTGPDNRNQDLVTTGSGSQSYGNPTGANVSANTNALLVLTNGNVYTAVLTITLNDVNSLGITNTLYEGPTTNGTLRVTLGGVAASTTFLTSGFDGLCVGWRETANTATTIEISSIQVDGSVTVISTPPDILTQPTSVTVPNGGSCAFNVVAQGFGMSYQWKRYGTNLLNGGNISGATSDTLIISPVSAADVAIGGNAYSVTVTGTGGYTTNSQLASLTLGPAKNLIWAGVGNTWDLNTSANWLDGANPATFNYGDAVTFDNTGVGNPVIALSGTYLSASSVTVDTTPGFDYVFSGAGSFAGPGNLIYQGSGLLTLNNVNTHTGGTIVSNAIAYLVLGNYGGLGSGPVALAKAGGTMEIVPTGGATTGVKGDVNVQDDFTIQFDGSGSFATVFLGNLGGTAGKTLTLNPLNIGNTNRIRVYGTATTNDANLTINGLSTPYAAGNGTVLAPYNGTGIQIYNGVISGDVGIIQRGSGVTVFAGQNTYAGGTVPSTGTIGIGANSTPTSGTVTSSPLGSGALLIAPEIGSANGSGTILAWGGARTIANPIQYPSATNNQTLIIGGTNALTLNGAYTLNGNDGQGTSTNRILQVNNTALTTIAGSISGTGFGLTKTGTGTLALSGNNTFDGRTSISNGTVNLNGSLAGSVLVVTNSILGGSGTINGEVTVLAGGRIAPGNSIGTLTINNNLSLAGHLNIEVNRSGLASDKVVVSGTLNNGGTGTVTVTNLGTALQAGDSFALFNKALANGNAMAVTGGNVIWTNKLAVDGTIAVVTAISSTPTNISYAVSGNTLTLSWPQDHLTWILQSNSVGLTSTNSWFPVSGSANSTQQIITVDPTKQNVFYRLIAP
jgi:autotransporter-associated beta strand protein